MSQRLKNNLVNHVAALTIQAPKQVTRNYPKVVTRTDIKKGDARIGDIIAVKIETNYELAEIRTMQQTVTGFTADGTIKILTGFAKSTCGRVYSLNDMGAQISESPFADLTQAGSTDATPIDRGRAMSSLGKAGKLSDKLIIFSLDDGDRNVFALGEILLTDPKKQELSVRILASGDLKGKNKNIINIGVNAILEYPNYSLLK